MGVPSPGIKLVLYLFYSIARNTSIAEPCEGQANGSEAEEERERSQQGKENI